MMNAKFGTNGTRYQEPCARCGRDNEIDNMSECCRRCHPQYVADREELMSAASPEMQKTSEYVFAGRL